MENFKLKPIGHLIVSNHSVTLTLEAFYREGLLHLDSFSHGLIFYDLNGVLQYDVIKMTFVDLTSGKVGGMTALIGDSVGVLYDIKPYFPNEDYVFLTGGTSAPIKPQPVIIEQKSMKPIGKFHRIKDNQYLEMSHTSNDFQVGQYLRVIWWFHRFDKASYRSTLQCQPPYENAPKTGIFATRSPIRPNPIATTVVKMVGAYDTHRGLPVIGFDGFENTPILGVCDYTEGVETIDAVRLPEWLAHWPKKKKMHGPSEFDSSIKLETSIMEIIQSMGAFYNEETQPLSTQQLSDSRNEDKQRARDNIIVTGARQNNLKNLTVAFKKNEITAITGVSGSGKSSLAFDTVYMECQRQFADVAATEHFEGMNKPDVDEMYGLMPSIAIEQKALGNNPRSTVGSVTGIIDYLKVLFVTIGVRHCPSCQKPVSCASKEDIIYSLSQLSSGHHLTLSEDEDGLKVLCEGISGTHGYEELIAHAVESVLKEKDRVFIKIDDLPIQSVQTKAYCYDCEQVFFDLTPSTFSYNNPEAMCPRCKGLGQEMVIAKDKVILYPELSILDGASKIWGNLRKYAKKPNANWMRGEVLALALAMKVNLDVPYKNLPEDFKDKLLYGTGDEKVRLEYSTKGRSGVIERPVEGVMNIAKRLASDAFCEKSECTLCHGERLAPLGRLVRIHDFRYPQVARKSIEDLKYFLVELYDCLPEQKLNKVKHLIKRMLSLLEKIETVGLAYLSLDRSVPTLSGGEKQRLRLASQFGTNLTNILYVMDEPSMGLHPYDYGLLAKRITELKDQGNTILMVEHEADMIQIADRILDIGPGAGQYGGEIINDIQGHEAIKKWYESMNSVIATDKGHKTNIITKKLRLSGAKTHNLKDVTIDIPLEKLVCVTGVSGSGKSSLIGDTLCPAIKKMMGEVVAEEGVYSQLSGCEQLKGLVEVTQNPIGRTPRSNPATYTGVFDLIRDYYAKAPLSRERGYQKEHFSFNSSAGQCPQCNGAGQIKVAMSFMPDLWTTCHVCHGQRYLKEIQEIKVNGYAINDILELEVLKALDVFVEEPKIYQYLKVLNDVGLGYLKLGQSATTLSGGEAQRLKLAKALVDSAESGWLYVFDEPTTGLHVNDIQKLIGVMYQLVERGNSVVVIDHNLMMIKHADYVIDMGPEGGDNGGTVIAACTPFELTNVKDSKTGRLLLN